MRNMCYIQSYYVYLSISLQYHTRVDDRRGALGRENAGRERKQNNNYTTTTTTNNDSHEHQTYDNHNAT